MCIVSRRSGTSSKREERRFCAAKPDLLAICGRVPESARISRYFDPAATRDDLREAVETLEDAGQIVRRVLGDAHPLTGWIEDGLEDAQDVLYARGLP